MTGDTRLMLWEWMQWRGGIVPSVSTQPGPAGQALGIPSPRGDSGVLVLSSGKLDKYGARRVHVPGIPRSWTEDRLLTETGRRALEGLSQQMVMGMCGQLTGAPMTWLIAFPRALPPDVSNPYGVMFRIVNYVATMWHTARAPESSAFPWP